MSHSDGSAVSDLYSPHSHWTPEFRQTSQLCRFDGRLIDEGVTTRTRISAVKDRRDRSKMRGNGQLTPDLR